MSRYRLLGASGREKSNRAAMNDWATTFRLMLLRGVTGATVVVVVAHLADLLGGVFPR